MAKNITSGFKHHVQIESNLVDEAKIASHASPVAYLKSQGDEVTFESVESIKLNAALDIPSRPPNECKPVHLRDHECRY